MKKSFLLISILFVVLNQVSGQGSFQPTNLGGPAMKYEGLKDTDKDNPEMTAKIEKGRKEWEKIGDTVLANAKKLLDQQYYKEVIQLLFPYDYFEPTGGRFYEYFGKAYFSLGYYAAALDCMKISFDQKKNNELLYPMGYCNERIGDTKEAKRLYKRGAKEGDAKCIKALEE